MVGPRDLLATVRRAVDHGHLLDNRAEVRRMANEYEALLDIEEATTEFIMQAAGWNESHYAALVNALARLDAVRATA